MALTELKWQLEVGIADNSGAIVPRFYDMPFANAADFDAFSASATALMSLLDILCAGVFASYKLSLVFVEDTLVLPASGVENENQAFFSAKIDGDPTDSATQSIPAAAASIFVSTSGPGANVVNLSNATVISWLALFDSNGPWTISDGEAWQPSTAKGKRRHVKNSNG